MSTAMDESDVERMVAQYAAVGVQGAELMWVGITLREWQSIGIDLVAAESLMMSTLALGPVIPVRS